MLKVKTVASVTKGLNKMVKDLGAVAAANLAEAERCDQVAQIAVRDAKIARDEAAKAEAIATNINNLVG